MARIRFTTFFVAIGAVIAATALAQTPRATVRGIVFEGPGYRNLNLAIVKLVRAGPARLQLRLETFNLLNTVNLDLPDPFLGSPSFGQVLSAGAPRRIQPGIRLQF